ncbi:Cloroperoxidase [Russula dissimulans]|nr:Cloroperoxidase [Russula dissimulans]
MFNLSFLLPRDTSSFIEPASHEWLAPQDGDVRSPCPALNTLANHSYLPHDGKKLDASIIIHALKEGYGLSGALANVLAHGGVALLGQQGKFGLDDLARHNRIEHDASLVHDDAKPRDEYAPTTPDRKLIEEFLDHIKDGKVVTVEDVARARVWRQSQCPGLNGLQAEIARGEMAIALGLFTQPGSDEEGIPIDLMRLWFSEERLPEGWKPTHTQGLLQTIHTSRKLSNDMKRIEEEGETTVPDDSA